MRPWPRSSSSSSVSRVSSWPINPDLLAVPDQALLVLFRGYLVLRGEGAPILQVEDYEKKMGITDLGRM